MNGVIIVDKAAGWTSHDVVGKMRRIAGTKRVGHFGTLDPAATGVLPVAIGTATRLSQFYTRTDKIYEGVVRFGWATTSYDADGDPVGEPRKVTLSAADLEPLLEKYRGEILQKPPAVSAKKVGGKRAYQLVRQNIAVDLEPVKVHVYELDLLELEGARARIRVHCSGGTYIRSIAHDLGLDLGVGAHLEQLRRTASGEFQIGSARTMEQLETLRSEERLIDALVPASEMLPSFPAVFVDEAAVRDIRHGKNFLASPFRANAEAKQVKAVSRERELIAIGEAVLPNLYHPAIVL